MNVHLKKKVTPKKLLGKDKHRKMSLIEKELEFKKLKTALQEEEGQ